MRKGKADFLQFFRLIFNTLLLVLIADITVFAQPELKVKLKDSVVVNPARPNDTVFYKLELENISNEDIKQLLLNRSGDPNTSLVPGSFQSTPIAIPLAGLTLLEDQVATITLAGLDPDGDQLIFTIIQAPQNGVLSALNPSSITESTIDYQPNTDFIGTDMFTFAVEDDDGNRDTSLIELTIQSVNDAPSFTATAEISILEDAGAQAIPWATDISAGPADESGQALTFNILNNNNADLFENQPEIASDGTLTFTAKANSNGEAELTIQLMDNGGTANGGVDTSLRQTLLISVLSVNDAPSFTATEISILEDAGTQAIPWATDISAGPADESGQALTFNILNNSNADLFENQPEIASDGTLTFTAKANSNGEAELVIQLMDNGGTANGGVDTSLRQTLLISVLSVNDAPSFTATAAEISILEDAGAQAIPWATDISAGPADESGQTLTFNILNNSNADLFENQPEIASDGTLTFTAKTDANGEAELTIQLMDNGGTANGGVDTSLRQALLISVLSVNDAPSFAATAAEISILEDAGAQAIPWATDISAGPADESGQTLIFHILSNDNTDLFENQPEIASDGTLTFTTKADVNGESELVIQLMDNGGTANGGIDTSLRQDLKIIIESVNDAPSFVKGTDISIETTTELQTFANWASDIAPGPADEASQVLVFLIESNDNEALFEVLPSIAPDGTLTFKANQDAVGIANIIVKLQDNGGTDNGGVDTSATQSFSIALTPSGG